MLQLHKEATMVWLPCGCNQQCGTQSGPLNLQDNQEMPDAMLSMDFKRVWRSARPGARPLSIWRPVGPPGYASLGDVAMPGSEPPARPVSMYKDVAQEPVNQVNKTSQGILGYHSAGLLLTTFASAPHCTFQQ